MKVFGIEREPVAAAMVARLAGYLVAMLVVVGVVTSEQETALLEIIGVLAPGAALLLDLVLGWLVRMQVTPSADPRDNEGRRLVPEQE